MRVFAVLPVVAAIPVLGGRLLVRLSVLDPPTVGLAVRLVAPTLRLVLLAALRPATAVPTTGRLALVARSLLGLLGRSGGTGRNLARPALGALAGHLELPSREPPARLLVGLLRRRPLRGASTTRELLAGPLAGRLLSRLPLRRVSSLVLWRLLAGPLLRRLSGGLAL